MFKQNPLTTIDFYKTSHRAQYPPKTTFVYSNLTPRSDKFATVLPDFDHKVVNVGGAGAVQELVENWNEEFFNQPKEKVLRQYKRRMDTSLGADIVPVDHVEALHDLGYLPLAMFELPEGARVDIRVPLFIIYNTHPDFFWLVNYLETAISAEFWKTINNATLAYEYRRLLDKYAIVTGAPLEFVMWQGHDFSARGMSGNHDAARCGIAHLASFYGTDTVSAIDYAEQYYGADADTELIGGSVRATEHSVSQASILATVSKMKLQNPNLTDKEYLNAAEETFFLRLITEVAPSGIISIVSDTFDFWNVVTNITRKYKDVILARDGKVVIRPDSGDPVKIIVGDQDAPMGSPEYKGAVQCLWEIFGGTTTSNGYKVLDSHIGLIYGDSITLDRATAILSGLEQKGFASNNIVFGIGSFSYTYCTRDTLGIAVKATAAIVDGEMIELYKDPATDIGKLKKSAKGLLRVEHEDGKYVLYDQQTDLHNMGCFIEIFRDGVLKNLPTLKEIRARIVEQSAAY